MTIYNGNEADWRSCHASNQPPHRCLSGSPAWYDYMTVLLVKLSSRAPYLRCSFGRLSSRLLILRTSALGTGRKRSLGNIAPTLPGLGRLNARRILLRHCPFGICGGLVAARL